MSSRAARKIHARMPWTKYPGVYAAPDPFSLWDAPQGLAVRMGTRGPSAASQRLQARADAATGVTLGDPVRVPADGDMTPVMLEGHRVLVPVGWGIAFSSSRGRDVLYTQEPSGVMHVLILDKAGALRELYGLPADLVQDLVALHFPRTGR